MNRSRAEVEAEVARVNALLEKAGVDQDELRENARAVMRSFAEANPNAPIGEVMRAGACWVAAIIEIETGEEVVIDEESFAKFGVE